MEATINPTVLVVNCGSSSLKFAIVDPVTGDQYLTGLAEALGLPEAQISWRFGEDDKKKAALPAGANHTVALTYLEEQILEGKPELIKSFIAVGHRVVSGGELFTHPTLITDEVVKGIEQCIPLAPLHNPAHLLGIAAARRLFSALPHVAIFDTAFHHPQHLSLPSPQTRRNTLKTTLSPQTPLLPMLSLLPPLPPTPSPSPTLILLFNPKSLP
jgi:acetate kinase